MPLRTAAAGLLLVLAAACAPMVTSHPALLDTATSAGRHDLRIAAPTTLTLPTGYRRTLGTDVTWRAVGRLPQGRVYRPVDSVFTIEGQQVHEAWLVVDETRLVGFYLPGESRYSPLDTQVRLPTGESK